MLPLIEGKRTELAGLCRTLQVRRLDVFGSAVRRDFDEVASDLDFLVEFEPLPPAVHADRFFALKEGLEGLFGRKVDLLTAGSLENPYLREAILADRQPLYAA